MVYSFDGFNYLIRLEKGERLKESVAQFVQETKLEGAWVNGLGGALEATLGFYDLEQWQAFEGLREVLSLTGNIAFDEKGELVLHVHGVLGDGQYQTVGGHVQDLVAGATLELFIHCAYQPTKRKFNQGVGLPLLDV
jgi:uncharacterized protein